MDKNAVLATLKENGYTSLDEDKLELTENKIEKIEEIKKLNIGSSLSGRRY